MYTISPIKRPGPRLALYFPTRVSFLWLGSSRESETENSTLAIISLNYGMSVHNLSALTH